jgi:hypothetical protein
MLVIKSNLAGGQNMKRIIILTALLLLVSAAMISAQPFLGLGIIAGQPTGLTAKLWLSPRTSLDGAIAWSFLDSGAVYAHTDFQYHSFRRGVFGQGGFGVYAGIGARYLFSQIFSLGVRVPVGLVYVFGNVPMDIFLEAAPTLELIPATEISGGGAIGMRYYF